MGLHRNLLKGARALRCGVPFALLLAAASAQAAPPAAHPPASAAGIALVIGNAGYAALPPVPACAPSGHAIAAALRRLGFHVIDREDAALGQVDGAIGDFAARLAAAPAAPAFAYLCGYGDSLDGRSFYLPVSAALARPTDVLSQGVLIAPLLRTLAGTGRAAVLALDLAARPGVPGSPDLGMAGPAPPPLGLVVVRETAGAGAPTPLAAALVAGLKGPRVATDTLFAGLHAALATAGPATAVVALHPPESAGFLAGAPPPTAAMPSPPAAAAAPAPTAGPAPLPGEADMTDAQRRQVQTALAGLGYYDGAVDGIFGPDTRAAIRRFQHELHAPMTGILTAGQATTLVTRNFR
ncbi:MAG: hypothetical protein HIU82_14160 [Proteobacteria bacterium]|nr:hypothetical protein [Pseudomonadota bacterium]